MSLRATIHATLRASTDVATLLGDGDNIRHFPVRAPVGTTRPLLVSQFVASDPQQTHGTQTDGEDTMDETLVQFTALADDADQALEILAAVRAAFMDPAAQPACRVVLDEAGVVATSPELRESAADDAAGYAPQLDLTFFHNPAT